jgi:hypothetical protein
LIAKLGAAVARTRVVLPFALAALAVAGCGGSSKSGSTTVASTPATATTQTTTTSTSATTPTTSSTSTASTPPGATAPGASLAVGSEAKLPYAPVSTGGQNPKFELGVKVTAIEKGTLSDFNGIKLDATQKASTPVYVKVDITNIGQGDAGKDGNPSVEIEGVDSTGETAQSVTFLGDFPRCEEKQPPKPFSHGKTFSTCLAFLVPGGIGKAAYTGTTDYVTSPVTWR